MNNRRINRNPFLHFTLALILVSPAGFIFPVKAAQLVDIIPTELINNWDICLHYESREPDCNKRAVPEENISLPAFVTYQTYSKDFIINSKLKNTAMGVWVSDIDDVDTISINNELVGKTGQFLPSYEMGFRQRRLYLIPSELLNYNQFNRIEIKTFSSRNQPGLLTTPPALVNYLEFQGKIHKQDYVYAISSAVLLLLMIFPAFFYVVVKGSYESPFFLLYLLSFVVISIARSKIPAFMGLDLSSAFKIESVMLNVGLISLGIFVYRFFELDIRKIHRAGMAIMGVSGLVLVLWPLNIHLRLIAEVNYWLLIVLTFLVTGSANIIALHKKRKYSIALFIVCLAGWFILLYDVLMQSRNLFELNLVIYSSFIPFAATLHAATLTLFLTHKYWHFFKGATYDHITGAMLRPAFSQRLSEEMQRNSRNNDVLIVAFIDIQQSTKMTASYGYSSSNQIIASISNSLSNILNPYDLICRYNDDQFCIVTSINQDEDPDTSLNNIYKKLINVQQPINKNLEFYLDVRIGGIIYNRDQHLSTSHLIQDASFALSKTKNQSQQVNLLTQSPLVSS